MALDGYGTQLSQGVSYFATTPIFDSCRKVPLPPLNRLEVLSNYPSLPFSGVSFPAPGKNSFPDIMVEGREDLRAVGESVVVCPPSENWI